MSRAPKKDMNVRAKILASAVRLIEKGGLASLSLREVARAAGVSHQAPYHYFADREAILAALAEEGFTILATRLERASDPALAPAERLSAMGRAYVHFACDHPSLFRVMFRPDFVDPERFPVVKECGAKAFAFLPEAVQACVKAGMPEDPSLEAHIVTAWSVSHGLACLILDGPLAIKLPDAERSRDGTIDDVMTAMQRMVEARMRPAEKEAPSARTTAKADPRAGAFEIRMQPKRRRP